MRNLISIFALLALGVRAQFSALPIPQISEAWSPLDVPNCGLWLDASDASTVTLSGSQVTNWWNKAISGDSAKYVGASTTWPTYCATQLNGRCTIYFDGNDYLSTSFLSAKGTTVFTVARVISGECICGARDSTDSRSFWGLRPSIYMGAGIGSDSTVNSTISWGSLYHCFSGRYSGNGTTIFLYDSGTNILQKTQTGNAANYSAGYYIGALNSAGSPLIYSTCYLAELLCYRRALEDFERIKIESYLMRKWGIQ